MEARVAVLEQIARSTERLLERMDARIEHLELKMDARIEHLEVKLEGRMDRLEQRHNSDFKWLLGAGLGATALLLGTMAHGFHWF